MAELLLPRGCFVLIIGPLVDGPVRREGRSLTGKARAVYSSSDGIVAPSLPRIRVVLDNSDALYFVSDLACILSDHGLEGGHGARAVTAGTSEQ